MNRKHQRVEPIPLDTSALIYPPTVAKYNSNVFRLSMDLHIKVNPYRLKTALETIIKRFPYFALSLHDGFFWYYLSENTKPLEVYKEHSFPCAHIDRKRGANGYLFKVFYTDHRIAVEFFHAVTDGTGGLIFLKSLVAEYLRLSGYTVKEDPQIFLPDDKVRNEELEDSFTRFYKPLKSVFATDGKAFHHNAVAEMSEKVQAVSAVIPVDQLKERAKVYGLTITEYIVCEILDSLQTLQEQYVKNPKRYKPIRLSVPVNIRKLFHSTSLRNFTLFIVVGIDVRLGHYGFDEIVKTVFHQVRDSVNEKTLSLQISRNVAGRRLPFIRYAPNLLKRPLMKLFSDSYGDATYSSVFSNLGNVTLPDGMKEVVERVDFYLAPSKVNKFSLSGVGVNGNVIINVTSFLTDNTDFERTLFTSLVEKGLQVEISSNRDKS
ncbi:MAG: hypothetical protein PQJ47_08415 [Sphaerochaetaceae bacterium]|nr:hypothetical protein [Sphaerochaetaceae bacterium]